MKAALIVLVISLLSACSLGVRDHALIAVAASHVVAEVGGVLNEEMQADFEAAGGEQASQDALDELDAQYDPLLAGYDIAESALARYETAIRKADATGDKSLLADPARKLLAAWAHLGAVADQLGVTLPEPPKALVEAVR